MESFSSTAKLRQLMDSLDGLLIELESVVVSATDAMAYVYSLPPVLQGEEEQENTHIPVTLGEGMPALSQAVSSWRKHTFVEGHSSKATYRLPGIVQLPAAYAMSVLPLVDEINRRKGEFKSAVQQLGSRDDKFEKVHEALPGVVTLQIYRQISAMSGELQSIGFTWADKQAITRVDRETVLAMLERSKNYVPAMFDGEEWLHMVEREIYDIKRLPSSAELRIRRPIKTHPMANIRWFERVPRTQQIKASLPLLICTDSKWKIHHLDDYEQKVREPRADRQQGDELLIERLHLYMRHQ